MRDLADTFKALADETRLQILGLLLNKKELCVCDFVGTLQISQSKASRHLRTLAQAGFLSDRRDAVWVHYRISEELGDERKAILASLRKTLTEQRLSEMLEKLDAWLESKDPSGLTCTTKKKEQG
jgi:ArsR family transcriptional regulator, arsenate/arsenite/antimonite-responsive transcriptional repressor